MTDFSNLKKFIGSFRSCLFEEGRSDSGCLDDIILLNSPELLLVIRSEFESFLSIDHKDMDLSNFWMENNKHIYLGKLPQYRIFFEMIMERLNLLSK